MLKASKLGWWKARMPFTEIYLYGYSKKLLGDLPADGKYCTKALIESVHPDERKRLTAELNLLFTSAVEHISSEYRFQTPDGWVWLESHAVAAEVDEGGTVTCLMGTLADITQRKKIDESSLQEGRAARQKIHEQTAFLATISHEIRTPLNSVMGLAQVLESSPLNEVQQHWVRLMQESSNVLLNVLNDVVDFARLGSDKLKIERIEFALRPLTVGVVDLYREQARLKPVRLELSISPLLPSNMVGDPLRIRQVLNNLLSNAIKFTPPGGQVKLAVDPLHGANRDTEISFRIEDTGIGIHQEQQQAVFEPFAQADASTTRRYGGSGLGLAICSRLVEMMDGKIFLSSTPGVGSIFEMRLPLMSADCLELDILPNMTVPHDELMSASRSFAKLKVIIALDQSCGTQLISNTLTKVGCEVHIVTSGAMAIEMWEEGGVDLILMDVECRSFNGSGAILEIRSREQRLNLPPVPILSSTDFIASNHSPTSKSSGRGENRLRATDLRHLLQCMAKAVHGAKADFASGTSTIPNPRRIASDPNVQRNAHTRAASELESTAIIQDEIAEGLVKLRRLLDVQDSLHAEGALAELKKQLSRFAAERAIRICNGLDMARHAGEWGLAAHALSLLEAEIQEALSRLPFDGFRASSEDAGAA